jgi:hypothetical protein
MLMIGVPSLLLMVAWFTSLGWYGMPLFCLLLSSLIFLPRSREPCADPAPLPVITYLPQAHLHEPLITLQAGQFVTVPWPHTLQVHLPEGTRLEILEATPERVRVIAV